MSFDRVNIPSFIQRPSAPSVEAAPRKFTSAVALYPTNLQPYVWTREMPPTTRKRDIPLPQTVTDDTRDMNGRVIPKFLRRGAASDVTYTQSLPSEMDKLLKEVDETRKRGVDT